MIRPAEERDIDGICSLASKAWSESARGDIEHDSDGMRVTVLNFIRRPDCYIRILEIDGVIRGMIAGLIGPEPGLMGEVGISPFFYVERGFRGRGRALFRGFVSWAFGFKSVRYVWLQISFGGEEAARAERFFQALGCQRAGASFIVRRVA